MGLALLLVMLRIMLSLVKDTKSTDVSTTDVSIAWFDQPVSATTSASTRSPTHTPILVRVVMRLTVQR